MQTLKLPIFVIPEWQLTFLETLTAKKEEGGGCIQKKVHKPNTFF